MARSADIAQQEPERWLIGLDPFSSQGLKARLLAVGALVVLSALPLVFLAPLFGAPLLRRRRGGSGAGGP